MTLHDYILMLAGMTDEDLEAEKRRRPAALTPDAEWDAIQWERRMRRRAAEMRVSRVSRPHPRFAPD